jgi:hypothetical protein
MIGERLPGVLRWEAVAGAQSVIGGAYRMLEQRRESCAAYTEAARLYRELVKQNSVHAAAAQEAEKNAADCAAKSH